MKRVLINKHTFDREITESRMRENCCQLLNDWLDKQKEVPVLGSTIIFEIIEKEKNYDAK